MRDLSAFQRDILYVVAGLPVPYGLAIKRGLEEYYEAEVNHGRLYPNLDDLVQAGLLEKSELDKRTNRYGLTAHGRAVIESRRGWEHENLEHYDSETASNPAEA